MSDIIDNCPGDANGDQADQDGDGRGIPCDSDIDGDLMPNDWETGFGLNPQDPTDADDDPDEDGLTNLQEFLGGTDPTIGAICGDGVVAVIEACDDGGTTPGDGCDAACQVESGWTCSGNPSICERVAVPALSLWTMGLLVAALMSSVCWAYRRWDVK